MERAVGQTAGLMVIGTTRRAERPGAVATSRGNMMHTRAFLNSLANVYGVSMRV